MNRRRRQMTQTPKGALNSGSIIYEREFKAPLGVWGRTKFVSRIIFKRNFEAYAHHSFIAYKFPELSTDSY